MVPLNEKEILAELKKFGIDTTFERRLYLREYRKYYVLQNHHGDSEQSHHRVTQGDHIHRER
jgi:hypothetical protein